MRKIILRNVRIAYPNLFTPATYNGVSNGKYGATFLIQKTAENLDIIEEIHDTINSVLEFNHAEMSSLDHICLRDGDKYGDPTVAGHWTIRANTKRGVSPIVMMRQGSRLTPVAENDGLIVSGCYVSASLFLWYQSDYKRLINAELLDVLYIGPDQPLEGE